MSPERPSVFIVDDHAFFRAGLRSVLGEHGFPVVGEAPNGQAALPLIERRKPDVVVMDLHMPGMSGAEATHRICEARPAPAVLVVTVSTSEDDVIDALEAGAAGYLLKDASPDEIAGAIDSTLEGDTPISPRVARILVERARRWPGDGRRRRRPVLADRELDVLRLLTEGMDNGEIAKRLYVSETTVKRHVSAIFAKLEVDNRVQAAIEAVRSGVI